MYRHLNSLRLVKLDHVQHSLHYVLCIDIHFSAACDKRKSVQKQHSDLVVVRNRELGLELLARL
jgi:hypothetical protein